MSAIARFVFVSCWLWTAVVQAEAPINSDKPNIAAFPAQPASRPPNRDQGELMTRYWAVLFVACALHGSVRGEGNTSVSVSSDQPPLAEIHETGWLDGDCAYRAVHISPDGNVYFTVSTESWGS